MARQGERHDPAVEEGRRKYAISLLERGYKQALVARNVGLSRQAVQKIDAQRKRLHGSTADEDVQDRDKDSS